MKYILHTFQRIAFILICIFQITTMHAESEKFTVRGRIVDRLSREPVIGASVSVQGLQGVGAATDTTGVFVISGVQPRHLPALRYVHRLQERAVCRIFRVGKDAYNRD